MPEEFLPVPLQELTEIRDLVAKYRPDHTPGIQKKPEGGGLENVGSDRPERAGVMSGGYTHPK